MYRKITISSRLLKDPKLPVGAKVLYFVLLYLGADKGKCQPGMPQLRQLTGIRSLSSLRYYLRSLQQAGWLEIESAPGRKQTYAVRDPHREARLQRLAAVQHQLNTAPHKGEAILREIVVELVDCSPILFNARANFLVNPLSDQPMEYDILCGRVALEFNGPQHYGPTEKHPDPEEARKQRSRDLMKRALSSENDVHLVVITPEELSLEAVSKKLKGLLPLRPIDPDDPVIQFLRKAAQRYRLAATGRPRGSRHPTS